MSNVHQAVTDIKNFANKVKGMIAVAEVLEKIGNVDQAEYEAKARMEKAKAAAEVAVQGQEKEEQNLASAKEAVESMKAKALDIEKEAHVKIGGLYQLAEAKAKEILDACYKKKDVLDSDVETTRKFLGDLKNQVEAEKLRLLDIQDQIAKMKKQVSNLF